MKDKYVVTIGRSFGSHGAEIGRRLAEKLGIAFYDKEILEEQVKKSGFTSEYLASHDEKNRSSFLYSVFTNPESLMIQSGLSGALPMDIAVQKIQYQTIKDIASAGPCVIVGRRADQILKDECDIVSVFVTAKDEDRVKHVCERDNISKKEAENKIKRMDRSRKSYYNYYGDSAWGEASNYDLCVNSSMLGVNGCVELIYKQLEILNYI